MAVQPGLCWTWAETPKTGFLVIGSVMDTFLFLCLILGLGKSYFMWPFNGGTVHMVVCVFVMIASIRKLIPLRKHAYEIYCDISWL